MNTLFELRARISNELAELLDAYFLESESICWGIMQREVKDPYEVFGIFSDNASAQTALAELRAHFPDLPEVFTETNLKDEDWQNAYKAFVKPWSNRQLNWVPLWEREDYIVPKDAAIVYLDAGMAFGTGAHETTRLCAHRLLDYHAKHKKQLDTLEVIDAGCGSGVLAFSAIALGFKNVTGFDFDPEAIVVCNQNAAENPHLETPHFAVADLDSGLEERQADLLMANIQTDVLLPFSSRLVTSVRSSGSLVLSGILTSELELVKAHYISAFAELRPEIEMKVDSLADGEWSDLHFVLIRK